MPSKKRRHRLMNAAQVPFALVGQQLGVGDPAEVVHGDVQAGRARAPRGAAAAPQARWPPPSGMRATFLTSTCRSSPGLPLVAHGVTGPRRAPPRSRGRRRRASACPAWRRSSRTCAPARPSWPPTRAGEQHRGAGLADPLLDFGRREPRQPSRAAASVGEPSPDLLLRSHLPAVWRLIPIWRAASATPRPDSMRETSVSRPFGGEFALGCCSTGGLLRYESRQLTACGNPPYLSPADVNNVLALNS